jgi:hypothetical protein
MHTNKSLEEESQKGENYSGHSLQICSCLFNVTLTKELVN